jgi:hypothetical protein
MKISKKDLKNLKPATERVFGLYEVNFTGPDDKPVTVRVAANDEMDAAHAVRNGVFIVDRLNAVTNLGFVHVPV